MGSEMCIRDRGKAVFVYEGGIRNSMYRFKYGNKREYAEFYANAAVEKYGVWLNKIKAEVLIPIPMYSRKKRLRGYNQAEVFAREPVSYTHLRAHETDSYLVCRLLLEKKKKKTKKKQKKNTIKQKEETPNKQEGT